MRRLRGNLGPLLLSSLVKRYIYTPQRGEEKEKGNTKFKRITQGVTTSAAETAEMKRGGDL